MKPERIALTRAQWMKVKRLYLMEELKPSEIAPRVGLQENQIPALTQQISRRGFPKLKKERDSQLVKTSENPLTQAEAGELEKIEAWKVQSEELIEKGFEIARGAQDSQALLQSSIATKNFLGIYSQASGMLNPEQKSGAPSGIALILVKPIEKAEQVIDIEQDQEDIGL